MVPKTSPCGMTLVEGKRIRKLDTQSVEKKLLEVLVRLIILSPVWSVEKWSLHEKTPASKWTDSGWSGESDFV